MTVTTTGADSRLSILPTLLLLKLERLVLDEHCGFELQKVNDRFEFPLELDMAPFMVDRSHASPLPAGESCYDLVGVIVHSGT